MPVEDVAAMFGKTEGFKASDPVITPKADEEDDSDGIQVRTRREGC